jgi:predicted nuclease of predicted toxin-antitoxin system
VKFLLDHDVPDDVIYSLLALGHGVQKLRDVLPATAPDDEVLQMASKQKSILITCNRDDFLAIAKDHANPGIVILIRRRSRALERAALIQLLDRAGETGIRGNINFA